MPRKVAKKASKKNARKPVKKKGSTGTRSKPMKKAAGKRTKRKVRKFMGRKSTRDREELERVLGLADTLEQQAEHQKRQRHHKQAMARLGEEEGSP